MWLKVKKNKVYSKKPDIPLCSGQSVPSKDTQHVVSPYASKKISACRLILICPKEWDSYFKRESIEQQK